MFINVSASVKLDGFSLVDLLGAGVPESKLICKWMSLICARIVEKKRTVEHTSRIV